MIHHELLRDQQVLVVTPEGPLEKVDFEKLAPIVDSIIAEHGKLNGLMIYAESFPGWSDFAAMLTHLTFVKNHLPHIAKVAAVTDSAFLSILPRVVEHFVHAEVRQIMTRSKKHWRGLLTSNELSSFDRAPCDLPAVRGVQQTPNVSDTRGE